jgi:hypothetical protein
MLENDFALGGNDIYKYLNGKIKVLEYKEIRKYKDIDSLLKPFDKVAILYPWKVEPDGGLFGHWVGLMKNKNGNVEYFNSYGSFLENGVMKNIDVNFKKRHGEDFKYLTYLLYISDYKVEYNPKTLQSSDSNTCGRWVLYRLLRDDLTIEQFNKLFTKNKIKNDIKILNLVYNI